MSIVFSGGCTCGSVIFKAYGNPEWIGICHCNSCRRATGGTLGGACGFLKENVQLSGLSLKYYESSPGVSRSFCTICGSSVSYTNEKWPTDIHLMIGVFDKPEKLSPSFHIFVQDQLPWICLRDEIPKFKRAPSECG